MSADLQGLKKWPQGFYFRKYAAWWYIFKQIFLWNDYTDTYLKNRDPKFTTFFSLWCFAGILLYLNNSCVWSVWRYFLSARPGRGCMDNLSPVTVTRPISICGHDPSFECSSEVPRFCGAHSLNGKGILSLIWAYRLLFSRTELLCFPSSSPQPSSCHLIWLYHT